MWQEKPRNLPILLLLIASISASSTSARNSEAQSTDKNLPISLSPMDMAGAAA